jgi:hypothetical protein
MDRLWNYLYSKFNLAKLGVLLLAFVALGTSALANALRADRLDVYQIMVAAAIWAGAMALLPYGRKLPVYTQALVLLVFTFVSWGAMALLWSDMLEQFTLKISPSIVGWASVVIMLSSVVFAYGVMHLIEAQRKPGFKPSKSDDKTFKALWPFRVFGITTLCYAFGVITMKIDSFWFWFPIATSLAFLIEYALSYPREKNVPPALAMAYFLAVLGWMAISFFGAIYLLRDLDLEMKWIICIAGILPAVIVFMSDVIFCVLLDSIRRQKEAK